MSTDDPREPRFSALGIPEPIRPDQVRYEAEPETRADEFQPMFPMESGSRNLWRLIGGIAAAIVLVVAIIVATRHAPAPATSAPVATAPATSATANAVATPDSATASNAPSPSSNPPAPSTLERSDKPVLSSASAAPPVVAPPSSPVIVHPVTTAPAAPSAVVSPHGPKHRRRGPSAAAPWLVQVGAFKSSAAGQSVVDHLAKDGWAARTAAGSGGWTIVEVTGYRTKKEAERAAKSLAAKAHVPTFVRKIKTAHKAKGDEPHPPKHSGQ